MTRTFFQPNAEQISAYKLLDLSCFQDAIDRDGKLPINELEQGITMYILVPSYDDFPFQCAQSLEEINEIVDNSTIPYDACYKLEPEYIDGYGFDIMVYKCRKRNEK